MHAWVPKLHEYINWLKNISFVVLPRDLGEYYIMWTMWYRYHSLHTYINTLYFNYYCLDRKSYIGFLYRYFSISTYISMYINHLIIKYTHPFFIIWEHYFKLTLISCVINKIVISYVSTLESLSHPLIKSPLLVKLITCIVIIHYNIA